MCGVTVDPARSWLVQCLCMGGVLHCPGPQEVCSVFEGLALFYVMVSSNNLEFHRPLKLYMPYI